MTTISLEETIRLKGALLDGHFLLSSGLHGDQYVQCAKLFQDPRDTARLAEALAVYAPEADLVVSPALGGILIGYEVARALSLPFIFTERADGKMSLRRGFSIPPMKKALIVEDVLTTGKSSREVMEVVRNSSARTIGAMCVIDRRVNNEDIGVPVHGLLQLPLKTYNPADCPMCKEGKRLDKPGSRPMSRQQC